MDFPASSMETGGSLCDHCHAILPSLGQHAHHQKLHANDYGFQFGCGSPGCILQFSTFSSLNTHLSKCHKANRHEHVAARLPSAKCVYCDLCVQTMGELCRHLKNVHIKGGDRNIMCPFLDCGRVDPLTSESIFSKHLSQYHKGWQEDALCSGSQASVNTGDDNVESDLEDDDAMLCDNNEVDHEEIFYDAQSTFDFEETDVFKFIGKLYLMLEAECFQPVTVIDKIAASMTFISEMIQCHMKNKLITELKSEGMSEEKIESIICKLADSNLLYLAHHKNMRGPTFNTEHLRRKFYAEYFDVLPPVSKPLSDDPLDPDAYQYVPVKETLSKLLADPSVQQEVQESFCRFADVNAGSNVYRDYFDGSVCRNRGLPGKRIDLFMFQDAFATTSMLTTVREKHKCLGMYMTLGNLRPCFRTKQKAMQLVMLILEKHVKNYRQHCFELLQKDLKDLEENGIGFMGEKIPVFLQFLVGDNLGSHFIGGFVECFTANFPCRFCPISRDEFLADPILLKPDRTQQSYNRSLMIVEQRRLNNHQGVKENSVFNQLKNFKVCDPGLPPCLGHDLFHGVVDWDLTSMIVYFVRESWFSYKVLNRRISSFKYQAVDSRNKPAPVKEDGSKLGGSAVQNWTLLRLLPLIIEGMIDDTNDEVWLLYLKLKSICELVCAPAITELQVNQLSILVQSYLSERRILPDNNYRPKHHYLLHYASLIRKLGPLIHLWGMRFEQKHQFFKRLARALNQFINLTYSLAFRHQLAFIYECDGRRFHKTILKGKSYPIVPGFFSEYVMMLLSEMNVSSNANAVPSIKINELTYEDDGWLILRQTETSIEIGIIQAIIVDSGHIFFVLQKQRALFNANFGLYEIEEDSGELIVLDHDSLTNPCPQAVYEFNGELCFSLKHTFAV